MSIEEKLEIARLKAQQEQKESTNKLADETRRLAEISETERISLLRSEISTLKVKTTALEAELAQLDTAFSENKSAAINYLEKRKKLAGVVEKYGDVLVGKKINNRVDLEQSPEFAEDEDILNLRESKTKLRETGKVRREAQKKLKDKIPDLNFGAGIPRTEEEIAREVTRSGFQVRNDEMNRQYDDGIKAHGKDRWQDTEKWRSLNDANSTFYRELRESGFKLEKVGGKVVEIKPVEKKTHRENSVEKVGEVIEEQKTQLAKLEEQTPEAIEEKRKTEECLVCLKNAHTLPYVGNSIISFNGNILRPKNDITELYIKQFGESALKKALLSGLSERIEVIVAEEIQVKETQYIMSPEQKTALRTKVNKMFQVKIDSDIEDFKAHDFDEKNGVKAIRQEGETIQKRKEAAIVQMRIDGLKQDFQDRLGERVSVHPVKVSYASGDTPARVVSKESESIETKKLKNQLRDAEIVNEASKSRYRAKSKKSPLFFGKEKHKQDVMLLGQACETSQKEEIKLREAIEKQTIKDRATFKDIKPLRTLLNDGLLGNDFKDEEITIGELLAQVEKKLQENKTKVLDKDKQEILSQSYELRNRKEDFKRKLETIKSQ